MIKTENVSFHYEKGNTLFEDISFEVNLGETLAILGANGVGKTTLIKCMMSFLHFRSGSLYVENRLSKDMTSTEFWKIVGYVPQAKSVAFGYTVLEMTVMGLSPYIGMGRLPKKEEYAKAEKILEDLGISHIKYSSCSKISGGQLQMALIARTLIKKPKILIMDEPESSLDLKNQMKILNIIENLKKSGDVAIIINTHFPSHALRIADKSLIIGKGIHVYGESIQVITKQTLGEHFGIEAEIVEHMHKGQKLSSIVPIGLNTG